MVELLVVVAILGDEKEGEWLHYELTFGKCKSITAKANHRYMGCKGNSCKNKY